MKQNVFDKPVLFGHRGSSFDHPENTLDSFAACLDLQIDGIELDVQRCRSGEVVVIHDFDLKRVAGLERRVDDLDYEELKKIDVGNGQRVPLFEEVLQLCQNKVLYDIELKAEAVKNLGLEREVFDLLAKTGLQKQALVSSFNPVSLLRFKRICRNRIPTALIYSDSPSVPSILRHGQGRHLVRPTYLKPPKEQFERARTWNYQLCTWTVDDPKEAEVLLGQGAMALISNNPKALRQLFSA